MPQETGVLIVVPARYASTRYPGKPLVALTGADGVARTLIRRRLGGGDDGARRGPCGGGDR
ncbi:hypothetical protein FALB51S_00689 [Frigidibacter albus]